MRIIITGGTGMIGQELAEALVNGEHEVIVLSRNPSKPHNLPSAVKIEKWDAKTAEGWGHLADGADAIINLAGENLAGAGFIPSRWTASRKERILQSRLDAGAAVVAAITAATKKPAMVMQVSGSDFYPNGSRNQTEADLPGNSYLSHVVVQWEASTEPVEALGVRRVVLRLGPLLSNDDGAFPRMVFPFKIFQVGGPLGSGKQHFPWVHHSDAVRAILYSIQNPALQGAYNVVAPESTTNAEFTRILGKVMKRPAFMPVPGFMLQLALGEVAALVLEGREVSPQKLIDAGFTFNYPTAESAIRQVLGK